MGRAPHSPHAPAFPEGPAVPALMSQGIFGRIWTCAGSNTLGWRWGSVGAMGWGTFARAVLPPSVFLVSELARSETGRASSLAAGCRVSVPKNAADMGQQWDFTLGELCCVILHLPGFVG